MNVLVDKIPITKPSITELEIGYVHDAIQNGWGSKCYDYIYRFEKQFAEFQQVQYAVATSSCTGAIHLALMALGIKAGDEVLIPDITWIASVEPVLYIGAKPVFVDVLSDTWCIDPEKAEKAINSKTKAIIVVHLYGNIVPMEAIMSLAKKYNLLVLEDAAEGLGSEFFGKKAGSIGDVGVFSFHGTKTISTGEGGMIVTDREDIFQRVRILNDHGRNPKVGKTFWMDEYGYKYKMSNLQAAMGCAQIERAEELINRKREIFNWYKDLMGDIPCNMNPELPGTKNSYWMPTVIFDHSISFDREKLFTFMKQQNIDSRPFFYPLSSLPMFEDKPGNIVSYDIYARGINLPSYHDLKKSDAEYVVNCLKLFLYE
jgi:perosamine synthetase